MNVNITTSALLSLLAIISSRTHAFLAPPPTLTTTPRARLALSTSLTAEPRQPIMAGNWKMNPPTENDAMALAKALTTLLGEETCAIDPDDDMCTEVVIFPPHPFISKVKDTVKEAGIAVGAQSIFFEDKVS